MGVCLLLQTEFMGDWQEDHRGKVPFLSHGTGVRALWKEDTMQITACLKAGDLQKQCRSLVYERFVYFLPSIYSITYSCQHVPVNICFPLAYNLVLLK